MKVLKGFVVSMVVAIFVSIFATTGVWAELQEVVILFEDGVSTISEDGKVQIEQVICSAQPGATIIIDGFASVKRFKGGNNALSEARALAVRDYVLASKGTKTLTVIARGHGVLGSESMDNARRVVVTTIQPEIRVNVTREFATVTEIATITVYVSVPATYTVTTSTATSPANVKINAKDGKLYIHDSLVPQNSSPLVITVDRNNWGKSPWKKDFFKKKGEWWVVDVEQATTTREGISRFNAIRGGSWIDPQKAICGQGVVVHENEDGSYCFVLVK